MGELDQARKRIEEGKQNAILQEQEYQKDLQEVIPIIESKGKEYWKRWVPDRLVNIFDELKIVVEKDKDIKLQETEAIIIGFPHRDDFSYYLYSDHTYKYRSHYTFDYSFVRTKRVKDFVNRLIITKNNSGDVKNRDYRGSEAVVSLYRDGKLDNFMVVQGVARKFSGIIDREDEGKSEIILGYTVYNIGRYRYKDAPVRRIKFFTGRGGDEEWGNTGYTTPREIRYSDRKKETGYVGYMEITDEGFDKLANNLVAVLDEELYMYPNFGNNPGGDKGKPILLTGSVSTSQSPLDSIADEYTRKQLLDNQVAQSEIAKRQQELEEFQEGLKRQRVLNEVVQKMREDPDYRPPSWITERDLQSLDRRFDHERYSNQTIFEEDLNHYFPEPGDPSR